MTRDWDKNADKLRIRKTCARLGVLIKPPVDAKRLNFQQTKCFIWNERKITVHSTMKLPSFMSVHQLSDSKMTKRRGEECSVAGT